MKKELKYKSELVTEMEVKKYGDANLNIENINNIKDLRMIVEEKKREIKQLNLALNNAKLLFDTEKNEHEQTSISLQASLQENRQLHSTIQSQMKDLNDLLNDKRNFGIRTS